MGPTFFPGRSLFQRERIRISKIKIVFSILVREIVYVGDWLEKTKKFKIFRKSKSKMKMKNKALCFVGMLALITAVEAKADATINNYSVNPITNDQDVSVPVGGTLLGAWTFSSTAGVAYSSTPGGTASNTLPAGTTVNGVNFAFTELVSGAGPYTNGNLTITYGAADAVAAYANGYAFSGPGLNTGLFTLSTQYQNVLSGGLEASGTPVTVTFSGLTAGDTYQVELWATEQAFTGNQFAETITPADTPGDAATGTMGPLGSYWIYDFTAGASGSETFDATMPGAPSWAEIAAATLYDTTAVPEPSTVALLVAGGLLGLVAFRRQRRPALA
jgi:hypothetical protein